MCERTPWERGDQGIHTGAFFHGDPTADGPSLLRKNLSSCTLLPARDHRMPTQLLCWTPIQATIHEKREGGGDAEAELNGCGAGHVWSGERANLREAKMIQKSIFISVYQTESLTRSAGYWLQRNVYHIPISVQGRLPLEKIRLNDVSEREREGLREGEMMGERTQEGFRTAFPYQRILENRPRDFSELSGRELGEGGW
ncbi:hypothetical protein B0H19DRAFT_1083409 [Mycena capillaripes]|nr:hypothetical protein B0H19DRAFT_1083409 [Mycena capillaripes]